MKLGLDLGVRTIRESTRDRIHGMAAEASFWTMLSLPPLLLALLALIGQFGFVIGADTSDRVAAAITDWVDQIFTESTMINVVRPLVVDTLRKGHSSLLSLGVLLALWSGSAAVSSYVSAITLAYDMEGLRSFWRTRLLSLALYLAALVVGAVVLPLLVIGPDLLGGLLGTDLSAVVQVAYWPIAAVLTLLAVTSLYHTAVPVRTRWRKDLPGAVLAMLLWFAGSVALRVYLGSGLHSDAGPVAAPIAVLLFFYLTALAVLLGAELNAVVDDTWPERSTEEGRRAAHSERDRTSGTTDGDNDECGFRPDTAARVHRDGRPPRAG